MVISLNKKFKLLLVLCCTVLCAKALSFASPTQAVTTCLTSTKKGVGGPVSTYYPLLADQIGVYWWYNWQHWNLKSFDTNSQFVPMIRACPFSSCTVYNRTTDEVTEAGKKLIQDTVNKRGTGGYWLIGNEPDVPNQDEIFLVDFQAKIYKKITDAIKDSDPSAKVIIGGWSGVAHLDYPATVKRRWLDFNPKYNVSFCDDIAGWHFHHYVQNWQYASDQAFQTWQQETNTFINYLDSLCPGKEIWITETGSLNEQLPNNLIRLMSYLMPYLENHPKITRYAWFYWNSTVLNYNMVGLTNDGGLTSVGEKYATYGNLSCENQPQLTMTPYSSPTLTPTLMPTATPTLMPTASPVPAPQCTSIKMFLADRLVSATQLDSIPTDSIVKFQCLSNIYNPATDTYKFRVIYNSQISELLPRDINPSLSRNFRVPAGQAGNYTAQCTVCRNGQCQAWDAVE